MECLIVLPGDSDLVDTAREMFVEYQQELGFDFCFQGFEEELATLPAKYAPPSGRLLLFFEGSRAIACGAIRNLGGGIAELKRIYVRPEARRQGFARSISVRLIEFAFESGYRSIRLDTLRRLPGAVELYQELGFEFIDAYYDNPVPGVVYMEKHLVQV